MLSNFILLLFLLTNSTAKITEKHETRGKQETHDKQDERIRTKREPNVPSPAPSRSMVETARPSSKPFSVRTIAPSPAPSLSTVATPLLSSKPSIHLINEAFSPQPLYSALPGEYISYTLDPFLVEASTSVVDMDRLAKLLGLYLSAHMFSDISAEEPMVVGEVELNAVDPNSPVTVLTGVVRLPLPLADDIDWAQEVKDEQKFWLYELHPSSSYEVEGVRYVSFIPMESAERNSIDGITDALGDESTSHPIATTICLFAVAVSVLLSLSLLFLRRKNLLKVSKR